MDAETARGDFPFFDQPNAPVYLDSAATTHKPRCVIERLTRFYTYENANVQRGGYTLAENATRAFAQARAQLAAWLGIPDERIAFTMNATDALNQAAAMLAASRLRHGSNVVTTALEHHSSLLPWMEACRAAGAELRVLPLDVNGQPRLQDLETLSDANTAAAAVTAASNFTGWRTPLAQVLGFFRSRRIPVVVDAAQRIVHERLSFGELPCDFLCFSGHKLYGPMGIGVMAMAEEWAQSGVVRLGGGMVSEVGDVGYCRAKGIAGLEAGTPPVAQTLGLASAIEYLQTHDAPALWRHEEALARRLRDGLRSIGEIHLVNGGGNPLPIVSFVSDVMHPADMEQLLSIRGFALRCGRHCASIAHRRLRLSATLRASFGLYNTQAEVDALLDAIREIHRRREHPHG